jgi:hypothetical protein
MKDTDITIAWIITIAMGAVLVFATMLGATSGPCHECLDLQRQLDRLQSVHEELLHTTGYADTAIVRLVVEDCPHACHYCEQAWVEACDTAMWRARSYDPCHDR